MVSGTDERVAADGAKYAGRTIGSNGNLFNNTFKTDIDSAFPVIHTKSKPTA